MTFTNINNLVMLLDLLVLDTVLVLNQILIREWVQVLRESGWKRWEVWAQEGGEPWLSTGGYV